MTFLNPQALYYLLPPLFILFGLLLTQKEAQAHFFSDEVMDKLRVSANSLTLCARNALFLMMGFFIVIAIAVPVIKDGTIIVKAKSADIMIALDISDSMLAEDVYPNRLELAKEKAITLLKDAPDERVGVMAFAKSSYLVSPLSFDTKAVAFLLTQLDTSSITQKGTDFSSIIEVFASSSDNDGEKYLLILSDGGDKDNFSDEIALAKKEKIVIFVLGVGTSKGAPIKLQDGSFIEQNGKIIVTKLNDSIADLATSTGGVYIESSTSTADIKTMLKEIKSIAKSKELKSEEVKKYIPLFQYPVGLALLFLLIATSSMGRRSSLHVAKLFVIFAFATLHVDTQAGVLDFMDLNDAKSSYEAGDYEKSAELYQKYAESSQDPHSYFNAGNAFYKHKKYKEAVKLYEKAIFQEDEYKAKKLGNLGNAHAMQYTQDNLEKAKKYYEESLKLMDDNNIRDNLEEVKKRIKEKKKEEEKKSGDEDGDEEGSKKDKDGDESMKDKEGDKDSEQKDGEKKDQDSSKSKDSKDKKQSDEDMKSKEEKEKEAKEDAKKKEQEKKEQLKKLNKDDDNKISTSETQAGAISKDKMSDAEEEKWLQQLNLEKNTYMYQLDQRQPMKEDNNEKPW